MRPHLTPQHHRLLNHLRAEDQRLAMGKTAVSQTDERLAQAIGSTAERVGELLLDLKATGKIAMTSSLRGRGIVPYADATDDVDIISRRIAAGRGA